VAAATNNITIDIDFYDGGIESDAPSKNNNCSVCKDCSSGSYGPNNNTSVVVNNDDFIGGCVVILQNSKVQPIPDVDDIDLADDDSILEAAIQLSMAKNHHCLSITTDNNDVHSLNSYICFHDQADQNNPAVTTPTETKEQTTNCQKMWDSIKDYGLFM